MTNYIAKDPRDGNRDVDTVGFGARDDGGASRGGDTPRIWAAAIAACLLLVTMLATSLPLVATPVSAQGPEPSIVPFDLPTRPAQSSATSTAPSDPLRAAIAKTRQATVFRAIEDLSGSAAILPTLDDQTGDQQVTSLRMEGEYNSADYHIRFRGLLADLLGADAASGLEVIHVADKTYVFGPAPLLDAPEAKWYALGPDVQFTPSSSPLGSLDELAGSDSFWAEFTKVRSGDARDGQHCDLYTGTQATATSLFAALVSGMMPPNRNIAVDEGSVSLYVCDDGYLHNLAADFAAHDEARLDLKGNAKFSLDIYDFGGSIAITPPLAPVPVAPSSPTPTPHIAPTRAPGSASGYDGEWSGSTSDDTDISFNVEDDQITYLNLSYAVQSGGCFISGSYSTAPEKAPIKDKSVTVQLADGSGKQFTFSATFQSDAQASGTLEVKGTTSSCGDIDSRSTWRAALDNSGAAEPTATPSPIPPQTATATPAAPADARAIVTGFFDRLNAKDIDGALTFIADDPIVTWGSAAPMMDKDELRDMLSKQADRGITYQVTIKQVVGEAIVSFTLVQVGGSATFSSCSAILSDGKIDLLTVK